MSKQFVEILNPRASRYTSPKRAAEFVQRGHAVMTPDGKLRFLAEAELSLSRLQSKRAIDSQAYDRTLQAERGGNLQGEWLPTPCGKSEIEGAPELRTLQFIPNVIINNN